MSTVILFNKFKDSFIGYFLGHNYTTTITSIVEVDYDDMVFNLSVQDDETYYCESFLVHNCRSAQVPILKPKFDLFKGEGTRASKGASGGKQVKDQSYYSWLQTQPKFFQQEVLGESRTQLFRDGGITENQFRKLISDKMGEPLTLPQIKAKNPMAWESAFGSLLD